MSEMRMVSLPDMHLIVRLNLDGLTCDLVKAFKEERLASEFVRGNNRPKKITKVSARGEKIQAVLKRQKRYMTSREIHEATGIPPWATTYETKRLVQAGVVEQAKIGGKRYFFVAGATKPQAPLPKLSPKRKTIRMTEAMPPRSVNDGVGRKQSTQDLIDHFMQNGGEVRRVEPGASGEFYNVRFWLESIGVTFQQLGLQKGFRINGKKMTKEQVFDFYDEERKKRGLEPLRVGGTT